eukprot:1158737-Pelagomonas_calceolata.AAC.3
MHMHTHRVKAHLEVCLQVLALSCDPLLVSPQVHRWFTVPWPGCPSAKKAGEMQQLLSCRIILVSPPLPAGGGSENQAKE